jgi:hypothetical protein
MYMSMTMTTSTSRYNFAGPYPAVGMLEAKLGVYPISTKVPTWAHRVLDVGQSGDVRTRIEHHDRGPGWSKFKQDGVYVSAFYCDEPTRTRVENELRGYFRPQCGER